MSVREKIESLDRGLKNLACSFKEQLQGQKVLSIDNLTITATDITLDFTTNTGPSSVTTSAIALQQLEIKNNVQNYTVLTTIANPVLYEFAYVRESQGTSWLPGSAGGTYYGAGLYMWDGTNWVEDDTDVFTQIQSLLNSLVGIQTDITSLTNNKLDKGGYVGTANDLKSDITIESTARGNQDIILQNNINAETSNRIAADTALQGQINANDTDILSLQNNKANKTVLINANKSLSGGGSLAADINLELDGDLDIPGNSKYYGTSVTGVKGYHIILDKGRLDFSGRDYMNTNNRWVGQSPSYGPATENHATDHGIGVNPTVIWNDLGIGVLPVGAILHSLEFVGRVNSNEITDILIQVSVQGSAMDTTGYTSVPNSNNIVVLPPTSISKVTPTLSWLQRSVIDLGDYVLTSNSIVNVLRKPVGTLTVRRYWTRIAYLHYSIPR